MDSSNQYLSASINESYCKQFGRVSSPATLNACSDRRNVEQSEMARLYTALSRTANFGA